MNTKKPILILFAVLLLAGVFTSFSVTTVHAAKWTLNLDASSLSAVDSTITASGTQAHGFRVGAVLTNASFTGNALTVYGWQFQITYNATAFVPQGDPNTLATPGNPSGLYTDSSTNTVLYGATTSPTTCPSWNSRLTAGTAFGTNSIATSGSVGQIQVAFTMLGTNPAPVVSAASCIFANVQFEIINPVTTPQTFTISNVVFVDNTGANIPGVVPGAPVTETITDVPPIARVVATGLPSGSSACVPVTGAVCSADAVQFDGTSSSGAISAAAGTAGFFWDFGDPAAACGVTTNDDCDGFYSGSTFSGGITCTNGNLATFGCQGGVAIHDYGVPGTFNVTLRVQDTAGNTGSARDTLGNVILNNQPSHTQRLNFAVPPVAAHSTTTGVSCSPSSVAVGTATNCTVTVTDTSASPTTPTGTFALTTNSTGTFGGSCVLAGSTASATCSVSYTPSGSAPRHDLITANYPGDSSHTSSSGTFKLTVASGVQSTTTSVSCTPSTVVINQASSCTATVTGQTTSPSGTVTFSSTGAAGTFSSTTCTLVPGVSPASSCSVSFTPSASGTTTIQANYGGDSSHSASNGSTTITVNKRTTTTSIVCSPASVAINQASTCTATVADASGAGGTTPAGSVAFTATGLAGAFSATSCTLVSGSCSVTFTPSAAGTATISGTYTPSDTTHLGSSSSGASNGTVTATLRTTSTTIVCSPSSVAVNQPSTCTATVADTNGAGATTPAGSVAFTAAGVTGSFSATSCTLVSGSCSVTFTPSASGTATISGTYTASDTVHATSSSSGAGNGSITVTRRTTSTTIVCSPGTVAVNQPSTCTATVSDTNGAGATTPAGSVAFTATGLAGTFSATSCTLVSGSCSVTFTPSASGTATISGTYTASDAAHAGSSSSGASNGSVTATLRTTSTTIVCSPGTVAINQPSTCTATVADTNGAGATTPAGSVAFTAAGVTGSFSAASCTLVSGSCSVTFTPSASGTATISGTYTASDSVHAGSSSSGASNGSITVTRRTTSTTIVCSPGTVAVNQPSTCTATVADTNGAGETTPAGSVAFTATGLAGTFSATSCTLVSGSCSVTFTPSAAGTATISGTYTASDAAHAGSSSSGAGNGTVTATLRTTSTTIVCSPGTVAVNQPSTCTATVADTNGAGAATPG